MEEVKPSNSNRLFHLAFLLLKSPSMDPKTRPTAKTGAAKPASTPKSGKGIAETARLFLDVDGMNRRSQTVPLSRYIE